LVVFLLLAAATASSAAARQAKIVSFRMPSKNIACSYIGDRSFGGPFLRCDVLSGLRPRPNGRCQEGDWVSINLKPRSKARPSCASDTVYSPRAPILAYGRKWVVGGFTCYSKQVGLSCSNRKGHGFFLSRQSWRVY
jgi:uncharacterized protein DUF6636